MAPDNFLKCATEVCPLRLRDGHTVILDGVDREDKLPGQAKVATAVCPAREVWMVSCGEARRKVVDLVVAQ